MKQVELKKLELNRQTLRVLSENEEKRVEGAALTTKCRCIHTSSRPNKSCLIFC